MEINGQNGETENSDNDSDTCDLEEIKELFIPCQHVHTKPLGSIYILSLSCSYESHPYIAAALSDYSVNIYSSNGSQVEKITQLQEHTNRLIGCKFAPQNNTLLYTGSADGTVKLWDLRDSKKAAVTFLDTTIEESSTVKHLNSFDISSCNRLLAAGTDLTEGDSFILFWDIRNTKLLGAYWECHTDDITEVKFHPENSNILMSGSTDGLINIYELSQLCEDDALQESLNTETLVENLQWFNENGKSKISCITSIGELQLWEMENAEPYKNFTRADIARQIKKKTDNTYLVNTHTVKNALIVLAGSNGYDGKTLRSFQVLNGEGYPCFMFNENSQRVRASWLNENTNLLLTGGEKGLLDIWKPDFSCLNFKTSKKK